MATLIQFWSCSLAYIYCKLQLSILRDCLFLVAQRRYTVVRNQSYANDTHINETYLGTKSSDMLHLKHFKVFFLLAKYFNSCSTNFFRPDSEVAWQPEL